MNTFWTGLVVGAAILDPLILLVLHAVGVQIFKARHPEGGGSRG